MKYSIYPSMGFARIGDSDEVFVGPESIGSHGTELGSGQQVTQYKDSQFRIRKQAARFHLFQQAPAPGSPIVPAALPAGAVITWSVKLANKKDSIIRPAGPPGLIPATQTLRPKPDPARQNRLIAATNFIGSNAGVAAGKPLAGSHFGSPVTLGELRVDAQGRLLVLGGALVAQPHPPATALSGSFYSNPDWHDDVSDGPVTATIQFPDGHTETAEAAWVVVGPPDFAPGAEPIVNLYDQILQLALTKNWAGPWTQLPPTPSFTRDIYPMIRRARSLGWVHLDAGAFPQTVTNEKNWTKIKETYAQLGTNTAATKQLRTDTRTLIKNVATLNLLDKFTIPKWQLTYLDAWVNGNFTADWTGVPPIAAAPSAASLTRAALEGTVGQGFFPGIEAGRILMDPSIYSQPFDFRIAGGVLEPGDITALMAQPWQADFLKCFGNWWPSQRPDLAPQPDGSFLLWQRPVKVPGEAGSLPGGQEHEKLIKVVKRLGIIVVKVDADGVQVSATEQGRDPAL